MGLEYWMQWHVIVSSLIFILPSATALHLIRKRRRRRRRLLLHPIKPLHLWAPCWRNLHPRWLLFYRALAFAAMAFLLYQTVAAFGFFVFFFYTQWTFALVMVYFALATVVSIQGCSVQSTANPSHTDDRQKILERDSEETNNYSTISTSKAEQKKGFIKLDVHPGSSSSVEPQVGFLGHLLLIVYQTCGGAVMLTDIVFWGLLLPFMTGDNFQLTLLIGCMHSVNAILLLIESALNSLEFPWFGMVYFVLWSSAYVVFQWALHACCFTWWPYPFLDLATSSAPLWYLALALVHIPCYGLYVLLVKAKHASFSKMFPHTFVRDLIEKKQD